MEVGELADAGRELVERVGVGQVEDLESRERAERLGETGGCQTTERELAEPGELAELVGDRRVTRIGDRTVQQELLEVLAREDLARKRIGGSLQLALVVEVGGTEREGLERQWPAPRNRERVEGNTLGHRVDRTTRTSMPTFASCLLRFGYATSAIDTRHAWTKSGWSVTASQRQLFSSARS